LNDRGKGTAAPAVSILLPVRDAGVYLKSCLRSIERQTLADFEVVAVDDGSRDGSGETLRAQTQRDARFRVVPGPTTGLVAALNVGLAACRGELVARLDADDAMTSQRLELQTEMFRQEPTLEVVSSRVRSIPRARIAEGFRRYDIWLNSLLTHDDIWRERFVESPVAHPSVMVRRSSLEAVGGYRDMGWAEDYDLWLRLLARGARFAKVDRVLHLWRDHPGRLTRTDERYSVKRFLACKAHHLVTGPLQDADLVLIWGAGQTGRRLAKALRHLVVTPAAFVDIDAKKIGRAPGGVPVHGVEDLQRLVGRQPRTVVLVAVARRGARDLIRPRLQRRGLVEGRDYWCVA
jgi:glycosyltransferase involved in cell wall biosynthesis